jgi:hypothetical protein
VNGPLLRRAENRIPMRMFVKLSDPVTGAFEITSTIDVSCHGARVLTKGRWEPNQNLLVRTIRGNLHSRARVVHCELHAIDSYTMGMELYSPSGDWTKPGKVSQRF